MKRRKDRPGLVAESLATKIRLANDLANDEGLVAFVNATSVNSYGMAEPALREKWGRSLQVAENISITRDLGDLIQAAAMDLPDDYTIRHHDLFLEHAWVYFERPMKDEIHEYPIRALTWHAGMGASDRTSGTGEWEVVPGLEVNLWSQITNNTVIGGDANLIPAGADFLPYGLPSNGWSNVPGVADPGIMLSRAMRVVMTLQSFLRDELPASQTWPVPRSMRGALDRAELPHRGITVIDLRKRQHRPKFDSLVEDAAWHLRNRHVVRGHWAKRWVGPNHPAHSKTSGEKEVTHVYIHPYIKGPEDAPIAMTEKVNLVRR